MSATRLSASNATGATSIKRITRSEFAIDAMDSTAEVVTRWISAMIAVK